MQYKSLTPNIGVKSVEETVKFYTEMLGFNLIMSVPSQHGTLQWAMLSNGEASIMFQEIGNLLEEYPQLNDRPILGAMTFYLKMKDMQVFYKTLLNTKYIAKEIHKTFYNTEEFAIRDNNGFILTITEDTESKVNYDNFFLPVDDYEKSKLFYSETLGLKIKFEFADQGMVAFSVGDEEPAIILKDKTKFPNAKPTIWIEVPNVKTMYSEMKGKGVQFLTEPFKIRTGWAVEFTDPSENTLGLADYLD